MRKVQATATCHSGPQSCLFSTYGDPACEMMLSMELRYTYSHEPCNNSHISTLHPHPKPRGHHAIAISKSTVCVGLRLGRSRSDSLRRMIMRKTWGPVPVFHQAQSSVYHGRVLRSPPRFVLSRTYSLSSLSYCTTSSEITLRSCSDSYIFNQVLQYNSLPIDNPLGHVGFRTTIS